MNKDGEYYKELSAWWKQYWGAAPIPCTPELPFRWKSPPATPSLEESVIRWKFPPALFEKIKNLSRRQDVTYFMIFFTAFEVLLYQLTGQEEMVIGTYVSDRNRNELKKLIGFFINMVALRTNMGGQPTFREVLGRARKNFELATAHQEFPFAELIAEFWKEDRPSPDVQVIFQFVRNVELSFRLPGMETCRWRDRRLSRMPWGLSMHVFHRADDDVSVNISFDAGIYDPAGVKQMMRQYGEVLEAMVACPETRPEPFAQAKPFAETSPIT